MMALSIALDQADADKLVAAVEEFCRDPQRRCSREHTDERHPRQSTKANERVAYFNGRIVPEREVVLPFRDRGFKYGDAAFDMTRTFHGRPFKLEGAVERLYRSLRYLRIDPGLEPGRRWSRSARRCSTRNRHFLTAGHRLLARPARVARRRRGRRRGLGAHRPQRHRRMHPAAAEGAGAAVPRRHRHRRAADPPRRARHAEPARQDAQLPEPDHRRSRSQGAGQEAWSVLLDAQGHLAEGIGSNIFVVRDGAVLTRRTSAGCCPGSAARP